MTTITDANLSQTLDLSQIELILPEIAQSIVEYPTQDDFPQTGRSARLYIDLSTGSTFRWQETTYVLLHATIDCGDF